MQKNLGKIINGNLHICSDKERKVLTIANPSEKILKFVVGYKDVYYDEEPEYDIDTQYLKSVYEESDDAIIAHWEVRELEKIEEDEI